MPMALQKALPQLVRAHWHWCRMKIMSLMLTYWAFEEDSKSTYIPPCFIDFRFNVKKCLVSFLTKTDLQHFLHFLTGLYKIPPLGLETHLTITYKEDTSKTLHTETCAYNLNVPKVHDTYEESQHYFVLTCRVGYVGFGLVYHHL